MDLKPSITSTLTDGDGVPVDLNGAEVTFVMRELFGGDIVVDHGADIVDASAGTVIYDWVDGDTDVAGGYEAEWKVSFADGEVATFPNNGSETVAILESLGAEAS